MQKALLIISLTLIVTLSCIAQSHNKNKILDKIIKLAEVKTRARYVERQTKGKRHLEHIWERPTMKVLYYWVKVVEDNGIAYHSHFNFFVYPKTFSVKYFDIITDKTFDLSTWRKNCGE